IETLRHEKYTPQGYLEAISEIGDDWRGGLFDIFALGVGDALLSTDGNFEKSSYKKSTIYRVEGEGMFLTSSGKKTMDGWNSRLFAGPGGSVVVSPNAVKFIMDEATDIPPKKKPSRAALFLNVNDPARTESFFAQRLVQYREAVEAAKARPALLNDVVHPAVFQFGIKSFQILTSDLEELMTRNVPEDGTASTTGKTKGIRRVDITKTSTSFECPGRAYAPIIEKAIPGTFKEIQPMWLTYMPTPLLVAIRDHQIAYGAVRTFVIQGSRFTKNLLLANLQNITDQEFARLEHGPVPLSMLSEDGVQNVEVRMEPVRRLRQSREVTCGRNMAHDVDHGTHMEYLAEFADGSTSWITEDNVALDLKREFWNVVTQHGKEVAEVVSADPTTGKITVKRPDGSTELVDQTHVFWKEDPVPQKLSDMELEALLYHGHYGFDATDLKPCVFNVRSDWGSLEIVGNGAAFVRDPAAEKAGEYDGVTFDSKSVQVGMGRPFQFMNRDIPLLIVNNGAKFDLKVMHGADGFRKDDGNGGVILTLPGEQFMSGVKWQDKDHNEDIFHIRPVTVTAGIFVVETDWGLLTVDTVETRIDPDPTVDQETYSNVTFTENSMSVDISGMLDAKVVIPFVITTKNDTVDISISHGRDKSSAGDKQGLATAMFGLASYTSEVNELELDELHNRKSFKDCKLDGRNIPT
ncbi:hypothetical protein FRB90_004410, partial [Tulasnella sp. 427]